MTTTPTPGETEDLTPMGDVDFAIAAAREDGQWTLTPLPLKFHEATLDELLAGLRRFPSESGVLGLVSVADDFFALLRVLGNRTRVMLSDQSAALEYPLAQQVAEQIGYSEVHDSDEVEPIGDLEIVADLGMSSMDLRDMCEIDEDYPDEMLSAIADKLGFGDSFRETVESVLEAD